MDCQNVGCVLVWLKKGLLQWFVIAGRLFHARKRNILTGSVISVEKILTKSVMMTISRTDYEW